MNYCPDCGSLLNKEKVYCVECGKDSSIQTPSRPKKFSFNYQSIFVILLISSLATLAFFLCLFYLGFTDIIPDDLREDYKLIK